MLLHTGMHLLEILVAFFRLFLNILLCVLLARDHRVGQAVLDVVSHLFGEAYV